MYYYINSITLPNGNNPLWAQEDVSLITLESLMNDYIDAYIEIQPLNGVAYCTTKNSIFQNWYPMNLQYTVQQWLTSLPTIYVLPKMSNSLPSIKSNTIIASNAFASNYQIQRIPTSAYSPQTPEPLGVLEDVLVTRFNTNYNDVYNYCLFTINGYLHQSVLIPNVGLRVLQAGKTNDISQENNIGIISFKNIGAIQQIPITNAMISKANSSAYIGQSAYINLNTSLKSKTVILSIGGYLQSNDSTYHIINYETGLIKINLKNVTLAERIFESQNHIDLSTVGFTKHPYDASAIYYMDFFNDTIMANYLSLSQSFVVIIDAPSVYTNLNLIEESDLPGRFITPSEPMFPLKISSGRMMEYISFNDHGRYVLSIKDSAIPNYQFNSSDWQNDTWLFPNLFNDTPYHKSLGHLVEIGSQALVLN